MTLFLHWALAFGLTQAIEVPIYLRAMRERPRWQALAIAFGASSWTHPIVAFVIPALWRLAFVPVAYIPGETPVTRDFLVRALGFFAVAEGFAITGEALYLRLFAVGHALRWSTAANLASSSIGAALTLLTGWP